MLKNKLENPLLQSSASFIHSGVFPRGLLRFSRSILSHVTLKSTSKCPLYLCFHFLCFPRLIQMFEKVLFPPFNHQKLVCENLPIQQSSAHGTFKHSLIVLFTPLQLPFGYLRTDCSTHLVTQVMDTETSSADNPDAVGHDLRERTSWMCIQYPSCQRRYSNQRIPQLHEDGTFFKKLDSESRQK